MPSAGGRSGNASPDSGITKPEASASAAAPSRPKVPPHHPAYGSHGKPESFNGKAGSDYHGKHRSDYHGKHRSDNTGTSPEGADYPVPVSVHWILQAFGALGM
jgi:hypothetical protein